MTTAAFSQILTWVGGGLAIALFLWPPTLTKLLAILGMAIVLYWLQRQPLLHLTLGSKGIMGSVIGVALSAGVLSLLVSYNIGLHWQPTQPFSPMVAEFIQCFCLVWLTSVLTQPAPNQESD